MIESFGSASSDLIARRSEPVREEQMVRRGERGGGLGAARCVHARAVAEERRAPRLVEGRPEVDAVAERPGDDGRVLGEVRRGVAVRPAAGVLELLREIPVVERHDRLDPVLEQLVREPPVEVEAALAGRALAAGDDPRPGDREPVRRDPEVAHERHVGAVAVVVVGRDVAVVAVVALARRVAERVPDGRSAPVLVDRALDLVRRGRDAPEEVRREREAAGLASHQVDVGAGHPLTAPSMIPPTICRPSRTKTISTGTVPTSVAAMITEWSGT